MILHSRQDFRIWHRANNYRYVERLQNKNEKSQAIMKNKNKIEKKKKKKRKKEKEF